MMIAARNNFIAFAVFAQGSPSKFRTPHYERRIEQTSFFEVFEQRGNRLVGHRGIEAKLSIEIGMVVPRCMVNVHEADTALYEPARQQTIPREGAKLAGAAAAICFNLRIFALDSVGIERGFRLPGKIDQLRRGALHPKRQFVRGDAAGDFRISDLFMPESVQVIDGIKAVMLHLRRHSWWIAQIEHRVPLIAEQHALIIRWQKSA